jgi:hypothetical protein
MTRTTYNIQLKSVLRCTVIRDVGVYLLIKSEVQCQVRLVEQIEDGVAFKRIRAQKNRRHDICFNSLHLRTYNLFTWTAGLNHSH